MSDVLKLVKLLDSISIAIDTDGTLHNLAGVAPPTVNDDDVAGYSLRSHWIDVTNDEAYIAVDVTTGAALWAMITDKGSSTYAYNADGSVDTITYANGEVDTYAYNVDGSVDTIVGNRWTVTFTYNVDGSINTETYTAT